MSLIPEHTRQLAQLVNRPGGMTAKEAITAAEQKLEGMRDRGLSDIAETICEMRVVSSACSPGDCEPKASQLYRMSNSLVGVAGVFGRAGIGAVALSLCTLIERLQLARQWNAHAIELHIDSLRLLLQESVTAAEIDIIVVALQKVINRVQLTTPGSRPSSLASLTMSRPAGSDYPA